MSFDVLSKALQELYESIELIGCRLIVGGGLGLYVRQIQLAHQSDIRTLIPSSRWPVPRSTNDIDWFLETSAVVSAGQMHEIKTSLNKLGYIPTTKWMQFKKNFDADHQVEIDLLTEPVPDELLSLVKVDKPRVRPKSGDGLLHAHWADSALCLSQMAEPLQANQLPGLKQANFTVWVPHPITMLLMKLHAFHDRIDDLEKDLGSHHALDIYRTIAMMTEPEYVIAKEFIASWSSNQVVISAHGIVAHYFDHPDGLGFVRIREHKLFTSDLDLETFRTALAALFKN